VTYTQCLVSFLKKILKATLKPSLKLTLKPTLKPILKTITIGVSILLVALPVNSKSKVLVDLIVAGDYVVTMDEGRMVIEAGAVAISDDKILDVDSEDNILKKYQAKETLAGDNKIIMPGLINGHTHTAMTLFRGMSDDLELMEWLTKYVFPFENEFVSPQFVEVGAKLACYEMIKTGTTTIVDMYFYPEVIAQVMIDCGMRAILTAPMIDFPSPGFKGWDDSFAAGVDYVKTWQGKHPRITPGFGPHAPYTIKPENLQQVGDIARELNAPISIHIAETLNEKEVIQSRYQNTPVSHVLKTLGDNWIIGAHMVHPETDEFQKIRHSQLGAIHNPTSNAKLSSGLSPVPEMLDAGINVGLGTDGAASNNDLDLFQEIRVAALMQKLVSYDPTKLPAIDSIRLATSSGAKAIRMDDTIGVLKPGLAADLIQVDISDLKTLPIYDVFSHLTYVINSDQVVTSIINGNIVMKDRQVLNIDTEKLLPKVKQYSKEIAVKINQVRSAE
jgi:5-methylthioadenosine/S-adenosylhomocysteine deaminase